MIKRVYGAHPLMIVKFMKPFLFVLILPAAKGLLQYLTTGRTTGVLLLEVLAASAVLLLSFFSFRAFSVSVSDKQMIIKSGFIFRKVSVIDRRRISCVSAVRGPFDRLFRSVSYRVNTEAGVSGRTDFSFKLRAADARELFSILYGGENRTQIEFPAAKTAVFAAASSSAITGLLVAVPIINNLGKVLGVALNRMVFDGINRASSRFDTYFPPAVNIITAVLIAGYAVSFVITLIKMIKFRLRAGEDKLETEYGAVARRRTIFKKAAVNNVCIEQTPIMRAFGCYSMRAAVGGYGDKRGEKAIVVPAARRSQIKTQLRAHFPFLCPDGAEIKAERSIESAVRFLWPAELYGAVDIAATVILSLLFPVIFRFLALLGLVVLMLIVYYGNVCYRNYRLGKLAIGDCVFACGSCRLSYRELYCEKERVGEIKITQTPVDRAKGTCKAEITVRSEGADKARVRNIDYGKTVKMIVECYGVFE